MGYKITNIEYGIGKWGTDFLYGFVGNQIGRAHV